MTAIVTRGDAGNLHLPDETVDLIVTSPPYFGLRSYQDGGEHYAEQIGAEATPAEYLDALMACTAEWVRVLKPGGSIFVNLGDKYAGSAGGGAPSAKSTLRGNGHVGGGPKQQAGAGRAAGHKVTGAPTKSLVGLPWRYAIRCIDELGLILRAEIVWAKPNGLPESVTDRVRRSHEQVFHFVKQPRYYSAMDEVREPQVSLSRKQGGSNGRTSLENLDGRRRNESLDVLALNPLGKLPGSVWSIPTAPLRVPEELGIDHFAAYPPELVRRIILGWSPREVCTVCGEGRRPVVEDRPGGPRDLAQRSTSHYNTAEKYGAGNGGNGGMDKLAAKRRAGIHPTITGYACACPDTSAPATPGVVLDPFGGTGTTALVASVHGRVGISNDLSADYCRLAQWRTTDEKQRAKAAGIKPKASRKPKPEPLAEVVELPAGQIDLFGEEIA